MECITFGLIHDGLVLKASYEVMINNILRGKLNLTGGDKCEKIER